MRLPCSLLQELKARKKEAQTLARDLDASQRHEAAAAQDWAAQVDALRRQHAEDLAGKARAAAGKEGRKEGRHVLRMIALLAFADS